MQSEIDKFNRLFDEAAKAQHPEMLKASLLMDTGVVPPTNVINAVDLACDILDAYREWEEDIRRILARQGKVIVKQPCKMCGSDECIDIMASASGLPLSNGLVFKKQPQT